MRKTHRGRQSARQCRCCPCLRTGILQHQCPLSTEPRCVQPGKTMCSSLKLLNGRHVAKDSGSVFIRRHGCDAVVSVIETPNNSIEIENNSITPREISHAHHSIRDKQAPRGCDANSFWSSSNQARHPASWVTAPTNKPFRFQQQQQQQR